MSSYFKKQTIKYFVHAGQLQMLYPCQLFTVLRTTFILSLLFETLTEILIKESAASFNVDIYNGRIYLMASL